jgi:tRNA G18 (ribose-2'-O)-methylase SpoU
MTKEIVVVLDNIRSMENVGSIFRTCDAAGVNKLILTGITPKPPRKEIDKSALGAVDTVLWEYHEQIGEIIDQYKNQCYEICSVEQDPNSKCYSDISYSDKVVVIFGNEIDGVTKNVLDKSDIIAEIPMLGKKNSLNVGVSVGIILYNILKQ